MSLIKCPECGKENVSSTAEACPNCGFNIKQFCKEKELEANKLDKEQKKSELRNQKRIAKEAKSQAQKEYYQKHKKVINTSLAIGIIGIVAIIFVSKHFVTENNYQTAIKDYNSKKYEKALSFFEDNSSYKDSEEYIYKASYDFAVQLFDEGYIDQAIKYFNHSNNIQETDYYLKKCELYKKIEGTYSDINCILSSLRYDTAPSLDYISGRTWVHEGYIFQGNQTLDFKADIIDVTEDSITVKMDYSSKEETYRIDDDGNIQLDDAAKTCYSPIDDDTYNQILQERSDSEVADPYIGMTYGKLVHSTWGTPYDKNITTTENGVVEQWCYRNGRYVYLEDGIVTSIQE